MKNGSVASNGHGNGCKQPSQNSQKVVTILTGNGKLDNQRPTSIEAFRRELSENNSGKVKPGYLLDLDAAWEEAEKSVKMATLSPVASENQVAVAASRPQISSPQLDTTTFKGETRSLDVAAKFQQRVPLIQPGSRKRLSGKRNRTQPLTSFDYVDANKTELKQSTNGNAVSRSRSQRTEPVASKPGISSPTLQTITYTHDLLELPEAYNTVRRPKKTGQAGKRPSNKPTQR